MDERALLRRIAQILNIESVTAEGNFFDLGGDSLAALELAEVLTETSGREVDMRSILAAATFRDIFDDIARRIDVPASAHEDPSA